MWPPDSSLRVASLLTTCGPARRCKCGAAAGATIWHMRQRGQPGAKDDLGGLKTKNLDIVATKEGIGPVLAISCKGMTGAFRNLTNRLEETIGECTNIHIGYPMLVFGYLFVGRGNRQEDAATANDVAFTPKASLLKHWCGFMPPSRR